MNATQALLAARAGLVLNSTLGFLLAAMLLLTAPMMLLEGEEPGAIILGVTWGVLVGALALGGLVIAATLESSASRIAARVLVLGQFVLQFCFCGVLLLPGTLAVWLGLLVADRERG